MEINKAERLPAEHNKNVAVLMCTYNAGAHLVEQLDSIYRQDIEHIDIWVSDDGSSDNTLKLLKNYREHWDKGRFELRQGPKQGFAVNFLSLACNPDIQADYYAFSDQDDIWRQNKLSRATEFLSENDAMPALYCSRTSLIDENGQSLNRLSPLFLKPPSFQNALVQSIAGGNTMVFNQQARELLLQAGVVGIISHDWWLYLLVSGAGGQVIYDKQPSVEYRQHTENQFGANTTALARLYRLRLLIDGKFRRWSAVHTKLLRDNQSLLQPSNRRSLDFFAESRDSFVIKRLILLSRSGIYRQTTAGSLALWVASLLKKI